MSEQNGDQPVVLFGHSMGCKLVHYFLHWLVQYGLPRRHGGDDADEAPS